MDLIVGYFYIGDKYESENIWWRTWKRFGRSN